MAKAAVPKSRMINPKVGKAYKVTWLDYYDVTKTWSHKSEINFNDETVMVTYGVCIDNGPLYVTLAGTVEANAEPPLHSQVFRCLKSGIRSIKELKG